MGEARYCVGDEQESVEVVRETIDANNCGDWDAALEKATAGFVWGNSAAMGVAPHTTQMRGRDGIEVEARTTLLFTLRHGKIERLCLYQDRHEALEAAGLSG